MVGLLPNVIIMPINARYAINPLAGDERVHTSLINVKAVLIESLATTQTLIPVTLQVPCLLVSG